MRLVGRTTARSPSQVVRLCHTPVLRRWGVRPRTAVQSQGADTTTLAAGEASHRSSTSASDAGTLAGAEAVPGTAAAGTPATSSGPSTPSTSSSSSIEVNPAGSRSDDGLAIYKAIAIGTGVSVAAGILEHDFVEAHQGVTMAALFCLGYLGIIAEEAVGFNKSGIALLMAASLWTIRSTSGDTQVDAEISSALADVSELIFFLVGAMAVVEVVGAYGGFQPLSAAVAGVRDRRALLWGAALLAFFTSAVLDNLTTTIVMLSLLQRALPLPEERELRRLLGGIVVVAANAGGAWTPIGDVTTTMLWIRGLISPLPTITGLFLPSLLALVVPLAAISATAPEVQPPQAPGAQAAHGAPEGGRLEAAAPSGGTTAALSTGVSVSGAAAAAAAAGGAGGAMLPSPLSPARQQLEGSYTESARLVLGVGVGALLSVPFFKYITGLPPYMGMLSGLGVLWLVTDALHHGGDKTAPRLGSLLSRVDFEGALFFLGLLLSVQALNAAGLLHLLAQTLTDAVPNVDVIATVIGLVSALIDNVPLVAATMSMYGSAGAPADGQLWQLVALCAGTGGSLLVIGSAAGVAFMGVEGASFGWYLRRISPWALLGYGSAIACYVALHGLPSATSAL